MDLYTLDEFASLLQETTVPEDTALVVREMVTSVIEAAVGEIPDPAPGIFKTVALTAATRPYTNPQGLTQENIGEYGYRRESGRVYLTDEERSLLLAAAGIAPSSGAFAIDTIGTSVVHAEICAVNFGAIYCSCGALLTLAGPLYETGYC